MRQALLFATWDAYENQFGDWVTVCKLCGEATPIRMTSQIISNLNDGDSVWRLHMMNEHRVLI